MNNTKKSFNKVNEKLYRKNKKLELLNDLILSISYKKNVEDLLNTALSKLCKLLGVDFGFIMDIKDMHDLNNVKIEYNIPFCLLGNIQKMKFIREEFLKELKKINEYDEFINGRVIIKQDFNNYSEKIQENAMEFNIKSFAVIPIFKKIRADYHDFDNVRGMMWLFSTKDSKLFNKHVSFLKMVRNTLSMFITEQINLDVERNITLRDEKVNVLGQMAGGIAHDFNNVLASIMGFTQMAIYSENYDDIKKYLDVIYKSCLDGKEIVDKIQAFTRKRTIDIRKSINLNRLVQSGVELTKPLWKNELESRNIKMLIEEYYDSKSSVLCNEHELRQVILNLVLNAIDSMADGGILKIKTFDYNEKCFICIEDTGNGIPEDVIEDIFKPFYSTKEAKGTGLGLSIVKDIIDKHKGDIYVDSIINKGTKFTIELDIDNYNKVKEKEKSIIPKYENIKVLIVDDKERVAQSTGALFKMLKADYDIEINSSLVLDRLEIKNYDIIFCDLAMPRLNGISVANAVREKYPDIKFVLMTGWPKDLKSEDLHKIDYILEKPFTLEVVSEVLKEFF